MGRTLEFYILGDIEPDGERWNWETHQYETVESKTSQRYFVEQLAGVQAGDQVNLYINSLGGYVKEALGIHNALKRCPATVTVYIDGYAASAASLIAMAGDTVIMPRNTAMMLHNASWFAYGNPSQLRKSAEDLEIINMAAVQSYLQRAGDKLTAEQLKTILDAEQWLTAESCVQYGLADQFADSEADMSEASRLFAEAQARPGAARMSAPPMLHDMAKNPPEKDSDPAEGSDPPAPGNSAQAAAQRPDKDKSTKAESGLYKLLEAMTSNNN